MATRKQYDWEAIEREYRAGVLSIREIARVHGCSDKAVRKKAIEYGWERDLSAKIAEKVRTEIVRAEVRAEARRDPVTEREIIEHAAATKIEIVRSHRKRIGETTSVVELLIGQLKTAAESRGEIENQIEIETGADENSGRRIAMQKAVALPAHASTAINLVNALKNLVAMERQAFSLDDDSVKKETPIADIIAEIDGTSKGLPA